MPDDILPLVLCETFPRAKLLLLVIRQLTQGKEQRRQRTSICNTGATGRKRLRQLLLGQLLLSLRLFFFPGCIRITSRASIVVLLPCPSFICDPAAAGALFSGLAALALLLSTVLAAPLVLLQGMLRAKPPAAMLALEIQLSERRAQIGMFPLL